MNGGLTGYPAGVGWVFGGYKVARNLRLQKGFDQDGGRVGFFAGREELADDLSGVGSGAVAVALLYVSVERVPGLGPESGS